MASSQGIRAGKAFVELYANDSKLVRGLRSAQRKLKRFASTVQTLGMQMAKAATLIAIPLAISLKIGANFEDQMSKVKAVTSGTVAEFEALNKTAKELGRTTSFTATQVAEGMVGLGRAGFSRKEIDQAIKGMLDLSRATDTEMAEATDIAGATLRQFDLDISQTTRVVDVLAATANGSAQTLIDLGESMKYVAPIAAEAGESLESTSASLGILANNGIKGSLAGTALARAYKNLADSGTAKTMASIGVSVADANGNLRPMADILKDIGEATKGMGNQQRLSIFEDLFGRGQAAALKLAKNADKISEMLDKVRGSAGYAAKSSAEMDDNLGGSFRMFMSAAEGVAIAIKDAVTPPLRKLLGVLTEYLGKVTEWINQNQAVVKVIAVIGGILAVVAGGLLTLGGIVSVISFALGGLATAGTAVAAVMAFLATPMAGVVATVLAAVSAIGVLIAALVRYKDAVAGFGRQVLKVLGLFVKYLTSGPISLAAELVWTSLKVIWENGVGDLKKTFEKLTEAWKEVIDAFVGDWKKAISEVNAESEKLKPTQQDKKAELNADGTQKPYRIDFGESIFKSPQMIGDFLTGLLTGGSGASAVQMADEGIVKIEAVAPEKTKQQIADEQPIMPEFAPEPPGEDPRVKEAREKLEEAQKKLTGLESNVPSVDKLNESANGTFSSLSQLMYAGGKKDEISKGDKFLGSKLDQVKNILEEGGLD